LAIVKSKLLKQLSDNYPNFLKKDLEKFTILSLVKSNKLLKEEIELNLGVLGYFQQIFKKQEYQETLKQAKRLIHQKKKQFTLKCQKTCLKN